MKTNLKLVDVENSHIKSNYYVAITVDNLETIAKVKSYENGMYSIINIVNNEEYQINELTKCLKFIAICDKTAFPVNYFYINSILKKELDKYSSNNEKYKFIENLLRGKLIENVHGNVTNSYARPKKDELVEIINLNIIDNVRLYTKSSRLFKIKDFKGENSYELISEENNTMTIICKRKDFKLINRLDYKKIFELK